MEKDSAMQVVSVAVGLVPCRELGERLYCAELGRVDVLRDKPQADKGVEQVGCAAGAEEHQRIPPEVAEPGMEFGKH